MTTTKVCIIDYGACNLGSLEKTLLDVSANVQILQKPSSDTFSHYILPGVGSFPFAYRKLNELGWTSFLQEEKVKGKFILGICLGMQLLATNGEEDGGSVGLDFIPGSVKKINVKKGEFLPHVGWNSVDWKSVFYFCSGIPSNSDFYFVHSYHFCPQDKNHILGVTDYGGGIVSAVHKDNVIGVQFHPEKSSRVGKKLLQNFINLC